MGIDIDSNRPQPIANSQIIRASLRVVSRFRTLRRVWKTVAAMQIPAASVATIGSREDRRESTREAIAISPIQCSILHANGWIAGRLIIAKEISMEPPASSAASCQ